MALTVLCVCECVRSMPEAKEAEQCNKAEASEAIPDIGGSA